MLPLVLPGLVAGSIFTFSLTLGDYITPTLVGGAGSDFIGNVVYRNVGIANNVPFAAAYATIPLVVMGVYLLVGAAPRRAGGDVTASRSPIWTALIVLFLLFPIALICLYAFNPSNVQSWPLEGLSTKWFSSTFHNQAMRDALWLSLRAALISTTIAMRARLAGRVRRAPLPLLRPRGDLARASCCRSRCRGSSPGWR